MAWRRSVAGIGIVAALLGGCATEPSAVPLTIPQHGIAPGPFPDQRTGTLRSTEGCLWLDIGGQAWNLVFPPDFVAVSPPLSIGPIDSAVRIGAGDMVTFATADGSLPVHHCPDRPVFLVGGILAIGGQPVPTTEVGPTPDVPVPS